MLYRIGEIIVSLLGYFVLIVFLSFIAAIIDTIIEDKQKEKKLREGWKNDRKWR